MIPSIGNIFQNFEECLMLKTHQSRAKKGNTKRNKYGPLPFDALFIEFSFICPAANKVPKATMAESMRLTMLSIL
jgi:hypothetical protein